MASSEKVRKRSSVTQVNLKGLKPNQTFENILPPDISKGPKIGCRHIQAALLSLGLIFGIGTRTNMSVAIVAMTDNSTSSNPDVPAYDWNNTSVILSAFFWSYMSTQVLAGYLGKTYGPKYFLLAAFFINSCACAATPLAAATIGSSGVILCRVIQGLTQGFFYPSYHGMLGTWAPYQERTTLNNFVFAGVPTATIFSSMLTGYIAASWWGWPSSFYILSIMCYLWCILWIFFGQNSPATHPRITEEEKKYIQTSLEQETDEHFPTPWKEIFTCVPLYAVMVSFIGNCWGSSILMTEIPTYLKNVMKYDIKSSAVFISLPTAVALLSALVTGPFSDWIISNKYLSTWNARRLFHGIGSYGQALCLLWLSFLTESQASTSVIVLTLAGALTGCILVGGQVSHLDLSPRFSGVLYGILNATGQLASIVGPLVAQIVVTDLTSVAQWRTLFLSAVGFFVVGGTVFILFGTAKRQSWDGLEDKDFQTRTKKISVISLSGV